MWWDFENRKVYGRRSWFKSHWIEIVLFVWFAFWIGLMIVSEYFGD